MQGVVAGAAIQSVVAVVANDGVVATVAQQQVIARATADGVCTIGEPVDGEVTALCRQVHGGDRAAVGVALQVHCIQAARPVTQRDAVRQRRCALLRTGQHFDIHRA